MKKFKGFSLNLKNHIVGKYTSKPRNIFNRRNYIIKQKTGVSSIGYKAILSDSKNPLKTIAPQIYALHPKDLLDLQEEDILHISPDGHISVLWRKNANGNSLLLTERCNCKCLMCPQPPSKRKGPLLHKINKSLLNLLDKDHKEVICITGGEPTLEKDDFLKVLNFINQKLNNKTIFVLTNGTSFSDFDFVKEIVSLNIMNLSFGISLHADTNDLHDTITRLDGSFNNTVKGIQNLALFNIPIEIRFVINKLNYKRMEEFALFIYRNFPFVVHIAFMGLELRGFAKANFNKIWIDPSDYKEELKNAVNRLKRRRMNVSIYNIPLCLLEPDLWSFSAFSISDWKQGYLPFCEKCKLKKQCCGVFTTSFTQSPNLRPIR